jgi:hypothetical protein
VARSRGGAEPSVVKTEAAGRLNKSSTTPPPSPLLASAAIRPADPTDTLTQVVRIKSEEPDTTRVEEEEKGDRATQVVKVEVVAQEEEEEEGGEEQVEYEEEGIQEVDIELGSGSDDDAHSPSSRY